MNEEQWRAAWDAFAAAENMPPDEAEAFLDRTDVGPAVRSVVLRMLHAGESDATSDSANGHAAAPSFISGTEIGRYLLQEKIGEGGMGEVWLAEQREPVRRRVALKLIKGGAGSREVIARFQSERQALALMDHPGIAKVFDAGSTPQGAPFFVMEYAEGAPITAFCDSRQLGTRARLELFIQVCEAVEHAHQKAIIHRDLKPSNILVTEVEGRPAIKVIDFGVAKALTQKLGAETIQTRLGALVGTPEYMSPEQAASSGADIDTRTDVYSLGVDFYELLTGTRPFDFQAAGLEEFLRRLREDDTPAPSSRVSTLDAATSAEAARRRRTEPAGLARELRGDLDAIALKALDKDRRRRYGSATAFAADIGRYLRNEPVLAVAPSAVYRARKFARRYRGSLITACAFVLVLVAATAISIRQNLRANREAAVSQAVNDFLQNDLLMQAGSEIQGRGGGKVDRNLTVRTALDRAAARIPGKFDRQPEVEAAIRDTIGWSYLDLGLYPQSYTHLRRALELYRQTLRKDDPKIIPVVMRFGRAAAAAGKFAESEAALIPGLELARRKLGNGHLDTLNLMVTLGVTYDADAKFTRAEPLFREALETRKRQIGLDNISTIQALFELGRVLRFEGKFAEAEAPLRQAAESYRRKTGPEYVPAITAALELAVELNFLGKRDEAQHILSEQLEIARRVLGPEHPNTFNAIDQLANSYYYSGKYTESYALASDELTAMRRVFGPTHPRTLTSFYVVASTETMMGKETEAEAHFREILEIIDKSANPDFGYGSRLRLAYLYLRQGKLALARDFAAKAASSCRRFMGPGNTYEWQSLALLSQVYLNDGKFAEAAPPAREAWAFYRAKDPDNWRRYQVEALVGAGLAGEKKFAEAEPLLLEGYQGMLARKNAIPVPELYYFDRTHEALVRFYEASGQPASAAEWRNR